MSKRGKYTAELLKSIGIGVIKEHFLDEFINKIDKNLDESDFIKGGYIFFAFESKHEQYPVIVSSRDTVVSLPVFVGNEAQIYKQHFSDISDLKEKIKKYYIDLLCNTKNMEDSLENIEIFLEEYDSIKEYMYYQTIGDFKTFAIEFEGWNILPIS